MLKFYTPQQWRYIFDCPSLIVDDQGRIWSADSYYKILFGEPSGRVDFSAGKIYGKDMGYGLFASPIGLMETKDGVTQVRDAKGGWFASPILYIKDGKVYAPKEFFSIWPAPSGYVKREERGAAREEAPRAESGGTSGKRPAFTPLYGTSAPPRRQPLSGDRASVQAREIEAARTHPHSLYMAKLIVRDWVPGGLMYNQLSDPELMVDRMTLVVSEDSVRLNVECDDSTTALYDSLPRSAWEKTYPLSVLAYAPHLNGDTFSLPLTPAQVFGLHERIRDELAKLPYYSVSMGKGTTTNRDFRTKEIVYMSTLLHIYF